MYPNQNFTEKTEDPNVTEISKNLSFNLKLNSMLFRSTPKL